MNKRWISVLALLVLQLTLFEARADDLYKQPLTNQNRAAFEKVVSSLKITGEVFRAFTQEKKIAALKRPLRSTGVMAISPRGICWRTEKPFVSSLLVTPDGVGQKMNGARASWRKSADHMDVRHFVRIIMALFLAQKEVLKDAFVVFFAQEGANWRIGLEPKGAILKKIFTRITVSGDKTLSQVTIVEATGDKTHINILASNGGSGLSLSSCVQ